MGRGGAPGEQEGLPGAGREQDQGGRVLQRLQDGRGRQDGLGVTWAGRDGCHRQRAGSSGGGDPHGWSPAGTFTGDSVAAEPVAGAAGAEEAARRVVAAVLAGPALARPPALVDVCRYNGANTVTTVPAATSVPRASRPGQRSGAAGAALTHAGVPVPVEVVAGAAGAAVAAHAVLAAVLARRGQALVRIWGGGWHRARGGQRPRLAAGGHPTTRPAAPAAAHPGSCGGRRRAACRGRTRRRSRPRC